jgi:hypothetical protein
VRLTEFVVANVDRSPWLWDVELRKLYRLPKVQQNAVVEEWWREYERLTADLESPTTPTSGNT